MNLETKHLWSHKCPKKRDQYTLIALVVTIIVLIILSSIGIAAVFGEKGLITQAQMAKEKQTIAGCEEKIRLTLMQAHINSKGQNEEVLEICKNILQLNETFKDASFTQITNGSFTITTKEGFNFVITENEVEYTGKTQEPNNDNNEKLEVRVTTTNNYSNYPDYNCLLSKTIQINFYVDYWDYWLRAKASSEEKQRVVCNLQDLTDDNLLEILTQLKEMNISIEQYFELYGTTMDNELYNRLTIKSMEGLVAWYVGTMNQTEEISQIIEKWNTINPTLQTNDINQLASYAYGETVTIDGLATQYNCTTNIVIDYLFRKIVYMDGIPLDDELLFVYEKFVEEVVQEYEQFEEENLGKIEKVVIKLPNNEEKEVTNRLYSAHENGTYMVYVTIEDETTNYSVEISGITGHLHLKDINGEEHVCDCDEDFIEKHKWVNGDEGHVCKICGYDEEHDGSGVETEIDEEEHKIYEVCSDCGLEFNVTEGAHEPLIEYTGNGNGTHSKEVTCAVEECWKFISKEDEDCIDEDEDEICDNCGEEIPI